MSKICEMKIQEDTRIYTLGAKEIREANEVRNESATYVEVLSFLRDIFNLVDFSGIISNSKKTIL
ncbi:hypothetical protein Bcop_0576 [Bacteroides coprosuis DSM 18011]|uniref:Uncharacterized protein n=1 Tax=Bacteroides coprosuis DSM 18011 TaxID=679937 RepID=F3ZRY8_9BACE|nr:MULTISPECIES: hypothetical protein [Bacteroides]EGJ70794.1 hypothetical protein Bcop_0576 [Bacteroides coprosuis DSM 18011]HJD92413.1 hypothetical protein [Bacteroides coprosuis]